MAVANNGNDLYEVILIESDDDFAVICPGIPGAISQGKDREEALVMIADAMAACRMYPLPGDDMPERQAELRELGKAKIIELIAECERDGWQYELHQVTPQLIRPPSTVEEHPTPTRRDKRNYNCQMIVIMITIVVTVLSVSCQSRPDPVNLTDRPEVKKIC
ncbi:MAG: type II toxin-antitoxin system HicB family antitoxin [Chloroflexota bacterium]|nr:type II toxin-antitoxin system HicB family antitoxin [Chloroflexota bacterium]MDE2960222.1 type II toxin-antitoxin system HicB family antitoxin [Chloroflexota bacterium]